MGAVRIMPTSLIQIIHFSEDREENGMMVQGQNGELPKLPRFLK